MSHTVTKRCTKDLPMPAGGDGMKYIHQFDTVYEGDYFDTLQCPHCGFEVKVAPKR